MSRQYVERRLYFNGNCTLCGQPFQSFKRSRIKAGVCRRKKCRTQPDPNQAPLFTMEDQKIIDSGGTVVREGMIDGAKHTLEFTKGKLVESIDGEPRLIIGEIE